MSLFEEKDNIDSKELWDALRNTSHDLPTDSKIFSKNEREKIIGELFNSCGDIISKDEFKGVLRKVRAKEFDVIKDFDQSEINRIIRYLKEISGITDF
ncbi:hypothetical protein AMJ49_05400 [Parcubacteria bacterium DG_74_2]|nr:MAG: hypothetical protein AMJ49_05400 [Parcubacteria bacterium DG_74_2]